MYLSRFARWIVASDQQIRFATSVFLSLVLFLSLLDCLRGANDGGTRGDGSDYSQRHDEYAQWKSVKS